MLQTAMQDILNRAGTEQEKGQHPRSSCNLPLNPFSENYDHAFGLPVEG